MTGWTEEQLVAMTDDEFKHIWDLLERARIRRVVRKVSTPYSERIEKSNKEAAYTDAYDAGFKAGYDQGKIDAAKENGWT